MTIADWFKSFIYTEEKAKKEIDVVEACISFIEKQKKAELDNMKECAKEQNEVEKNIEKYLDIDIESLSSVEKAHYDTYSTQYKSIESRMDILQGRLQFLNNIYIGLWEICNHAQALVDNGLYEEVIKSIPEKMLPRMIRNIKETENIEKMVVDLMAKLKQVVAKHKIVIEMYSKKQSTITEKFKLMDQESDKSRLEREKEEQEKMRLNIQKKREREQAYVRAIDMPITVEDPQTAINTNTNKN